MKFGAVPLGVNSHGPTDFSFVAGKLCEALKGLTMANTGVDTEMHLNLRRRWFCIAEATRDLAQLTRNTLRQVQE